jgi:tetratricopeptide (TPR) repeat protein
MRETGNLGHVLLLLGRFEEAREQFERSLALAREFGERRSEGFALQGLANIPAEEGDDILAERRYAEALALRREIGHRVGEAQTLVVRGAHRAQQTRGDDARADLDAALALARELSLPDVELLATAQLATLPGGPPLDRPQHGLGPWSRALRDRPADDHARPGDKVEAALAALATHEGRVEMQEVLMARFLLWQATRDPAHLAEAKRRLDFMFEYAPPDCRESMLANVRLHREIAAAAREAGLTLAADSKRAGDGRSSASAEA